MRNIQPASPLAIEGKHSQAHRRGHAADQKRDGDQPGRALASSRATAQVGVHRGARPQESQSHQQDKVGTYAASRGPAVFELSHTGNDNARGVW